MCKELYSATIASHLGDISRTPPRWPSDLTALDCYEGSSSMYQPGTRLRGNEGTSVDFRDLNLRPPLTDHMGGTNAQLLLPRPELQSTLPVRILCSTTVVLSQLLDSSTRTTLPLAYRGYVQDTTTSGLSVGVKKSTKSLRFFFLRRDHFSGQISRTHPSSPRLHASHPRRHHQEHEVFT